MMHDIPDLQSYDTIIVAFSGGKDSIGCLLTLIDAGVPADRIELHHHDVDGQGDPFMDWPCTTAYCRSLARHFGVPLFLSWKEGGFLREMLRENAPTAPIRFELPDGSMGTVGGTGSRGTRLRFPQTTASLSQRWCSAYLKVDVMAAVIRAQPRFLGRRTLIVTGERAQESRARAGYALLEPDRTDTRSGTRRRRHVDHWRAVHHLSEAGVWDLMRRHGIVPAPAYRLGWSRLSCLACIFGGPDQWASLRAMAPEWFERIARYEDRFGCTIHRLCSIRSLAGRGRPYEAALAQPSLAARALSTDWSEPVQVGTCDWQIPAGAFGSSSGPP
ncbi:MAG: phosphoadenosine phosphosulfate reductase family protein [Rhodospirillales bacterium]|nr:phosphoadenosine phosphosulfate reductase family protein [Rhodospirillales bacterium]